jgi:hypothetical protein
MANNIKCPQCGNQFDVEAVIASDLEEKLKKEYEQKLRQSFESLQQDKLRLQEEQRQFEDKRKKENEIFLQKIGQEKLKMEKEIQEQVRKSITEDFELKLRLLENNNRDQEEKLNESRRKEVEFLQKEQLLKTKEDELELRLQKKLQEERTSLTETIRKQELEKISLKETDYQMRLKELEMQVEAQRKLAEEMKRRAEQGSMQVQGEAQELVLQDMLKAAFPFDVVCEVGKGVKGADCVLTIRNNLGQECGKIIFESKRTKDFSQEWIEKLKADMRSERADLAVIVTQSMPKDMDRFGERSGVWICTFNEAKALVQVLRESIIKIFNSTRVQQNRGDKMHMLYDYLTSHEFAEQWSAIREGFVAMKVSIQKERDAMERLWKAREKQLEKVLLNSAHIRGSIEGIAGTDTIDLNLLEESNGEEEL